MKSRNNCRSSRKVTTVIIGGGHAGLATSHCLTERSIDHVVLERGEVANSWRHERWDSLRLLTPNWQSRLPGYHYDGADPDGFMTMPQVIAFIERYATVSSTPVCSQTRVTAVSPTDEGFRVETNRGEWQCRALVIASGAFNVPVVPALATSLPGNIQSLTPHQYRHPRQLADGGVLVVGAAATGLQIADEIQRSGRPVTLAAGEHVRMPRSYRGRDIQFWMHTTGMLDECYEQVDDIRRARRLPSSQLVGTVEKTTLDLNGLSRRGVQLVGRLAGIRGSRAQFSGSLGNIAKLADLKLGRLLRSIDGWIEENDWAGGIGAPEQPEPTQIDPSPRLDMDLASGEIKTVIWATGFRPDYSWLQVPVLDHKGWIRHDGGVAATPGLYAMGLPFMRRRKSSFIFGAEDDARDISNHLAAYVRGSPRQNMVRVA
jgi:putative flavoprotein involved in K+ transport